jgi:hypothetical protein
MFKKFGAARKIVSARVVGAARAEPPTGRLLDSSPDSSRARSQPRRRLDRQHRIPALGDDALPRLGLGRGDLWPEVVAARMSAVAWS